MKDVFNTFIINQIHTCICLNKENWKGEKKLEDKIDVFLLAAGEANRMYPLNQILEKSLLPVNGKPVIRHIVDNLRKCDKIGKITICCLTRFKKQFEHEFRDVDVEILRFDEPCGTYSTWWNSVDSNTSEWCMVYYADCLTEIDYNDFMSDIDNPYVNGIIAVTNTVKHDYSEVIFHKDKGVIEFNEKPKLSNYTWSGIGLFRTKAVEKIDNGYKNRDFAFDIFPKMIEEGTLRAYPYHGAWSDVGNLNSYRKICERFNGELK